MSSLDRLSDFLVQLDKNEEQAAAAAQAPAAEAPVAEAPASPLDALADFMARLDVETAPGAAPGSAPGEQDLTAAAAKMYENEVVLPEAVGSIPREIERGGRLTVEQAAAAIATPGIRGQLIQSIYNGAWTLAELASAGMGPAMREIRTQSPELKEAITGAAAQETSMAIERAAFDNPMDPTRVREELIAAQGAAQGISKGQREGIVGDIARATGQSLTQFAAMAPAVALGTPVAGAALASQLYLPGSSYTAGALEYIDQMNRDRAEAAMEGRDLPEFTLSGMRDYAATSALINTGVEMGGAAIGGKIIGKIAKGATASKIGQAALKPLIDRGMPIVERAMVSKVGSKGLQTFARLSENTLEFRNGFFGKALAMGATSGLEEGGEELVTAALMAPFTSAPLSEDIANGLYSSMIGIAAGGVGGTAPIGAFAVRQGIVNRADAMRAETDRERVLRQIHSEALQRKTNWTKDLTEEQNARLSTALDSVNGMDQEQRGTFLRELGDRRVDVRNNVDNLLTQRQQLDIGLTGARDLAENGTDEEKAAAKDQEAQILGQIETLDEQLRLASSDAMMADAQYSAVAEKIGEMPATIEQAQPEQVLTDVSTRAGVELKPVAMPKNGRRAQAQVEALGRKVVWFRPSTGTFSPAFHSMRSRGVVYMNADAPPTNVLANALEEVFHDIQMFQPELAQVFMDKAGLMPVYQAGVAYAAQGTKESAGKAQLDKAAIAQAESAVSELAGEGATVSPEVARAGAARIEQEGTANAFAAAARATGSGSILAPLQQFAARRGFLGRDVMAAMAVLDAASRAAAVETVEGTKPVATLSPLARTLLWANDMNLDFKGELDAAESFARGETEGQQARGISENERDLMDQVAKIQRGEPEDAMLAVQQAIGGSGVLGVVVEHGGDISNRIADGLARFNDPQLLGEPLKKTNRILGYLKQGYGFEKEMMEQLSRHAKDINRPVADVEAEVNARLQEFADAHRKIPDVSVPITLANRGNIAVGERRFDDAIDAFTQLKNLMEDDERYQKESRAIYRRSVTGERVYLSGATESMARASDTEYLAAVERGDMEAAQRMVDEAAKAAGYQYVGYHASMQDFTEFLSLIEQAEARGEEFDYDGYEGGNLGRGFYFTPDLTYAKRFGKPRKFYLKIENIVDSRNESVKDRLRQIYADIVDDQGGAQQGEAYDALMDETNADGVIAEDAGGFAYGATELLVKRSNQAKLADPVTRDEQGNVIPLSQRFDTSRAEISYARPSEDPEVTALRQQIADLTRQMRDVQNTTAAQRVNALREVRILERKLSAAQLLAEQKVGQAARSAARLEIQKQVNRDAKQAAEEAAATMSKDLESARATVASLRQQLREAKSNADTEDLLREAEKKLDRVANWSYAIGRNEGLVAGQVAGMQQERREQLRVIKPLKERLPLVEARLAKATEDLRAARKQIAQDERSAQKAVDFAYQLGLRSGQMQGMMRGRQVLLRKMAQREDTLQRQLTGLRDLMATKVTNLESLRAAISQIATDAARTLPVRLRGPLAVRIANAKTLGQANRIAVEATKLAINEEVSSTLKTIARLKKQMNKRGMKYDTRVQIETLLRDADAALRQANRRRIYASVGVMKNAAGKSMGAAILNAVNVYSQVADAAAKVDAALVLYTNDAAAFKAEKQARVAKYQADTAALVANMQGRPTLPMRDRTDQPVRTSLARRIRVANSDIYTLQLELEGKSDGIINKLLTAAQQGKGASALEHAAIIRQLEPLLQAAGYTGLDDYALKNGMLGQTIVNPVTVTLGGRNVTIPVGTMLSIAAMDDETLNVFPKAGEPLTQGIRFPGSRTTTTIYPTREEIIALKASLTPGQQAFIDGMKSILETQIRDRTMDAIWKIEGDQPPIVQNYWPRIRDMAGFEGESAGVLNQAGALVRGALTSVGFANARTGGNRPFLYSDAFQTWDRHIQVALDMIHMAQPYRDAATVLSDQNVVELIDRQMGPGTANAVLSIFSNGVGATARTNATIIDKLTNNVTGAVLSLSPRTWAKVQTGGIIRLASEVGPVYLAEGTAKTTAMLRSPQMWQARVEQVHSQSGYFTHRHQMNMRSIMSGTMSEQDRIKVMTAAKAVYKSIAAATDSSRAANYTDTLNSLGNAQDNANIVLSSLVDVLRAIDENIMLTAVEARLAEAKDQGYVGAAAFTIAVERAEQDFRRSQNSSDEFDETAFAAETRTSNKSPAWRMLFPFSSDTLKARNQIRRAWLSGERRAGTALAIGGNLTTNAVINAASVMTLLYMVKTISSVLGGADEPTDEEDKAFDKAVKELPVNVASELTGQVGGYVGIALQGVITAAMYRRAPMQALITRPLEQATREVGKISGEDGSWAYLAPAILAVAQLRGVPAYQLYAFVAKQIPEAEKTPKEKLQKRLESIQERFSPEEIRKRVLQRAKNAGRVSIPLP